MLAYKINVLAELKAAGYNQTRIRNENILPQSAVTKIRQNEMVGVITLDTLCSLLGKQPGEIIEWIPSTEKEDV